MRRAPILFCVLLAAPAVANPITDAWKYHARQPEGGPPQGATADKAKAKLANDAGMSRYRAGDLEGAREQFERAVAYDDGYAIAHYNLACVLARKLPEPLTTEIAPCDTPYSPGAVLYHLGRAIELDPSRRERMREDSDLDNIRPLLAYDVLDGKDLSDPEVLREALKDTKLWGIKPGAYPAARVILRADNTAVRAVERDGATVEETGTWSVGSDGLIQTIFEGAGGMLRVSPNGDLRGEDGKPGYLNDPDACSA